jgi:ubiquinone/menaquinone biosynthesis C-methylase UbiE
MENNYWIDFWKDHGASSNKSDIQTQVLRTLNKKPISNDLWEYTLEEIDKIFIINQNDRVLDLCCGNGLLSQHFVEKGATVVAVDVSDELLSQMNHVDAIKTINSDIRHLEFKAGSFDKVIIYAGIQYLTNKEAVELLKRVYSWLKPEGVLFIGDIPDVSKLWSFYNSVERKKAYFDNLLNDTAIVGNWYDIQWLESLTSFIGFNFGTVIPQNPKLIYSNFRFDFLYKKI